MSNVLWLLKFYVLFATCYLVGYAVIVPATPEVFESCVPPQTSSRPRCQLKRDENHKPLMVHCNGGVTPRAYTYFYLPGGGDTPRAMIICNVSGPSFDPTFLANFTRMSNLSIINSNISNFTMDFPDHNNLKLLNLTRLRLTRIRVELFINLKVLKILDLSYNKILKLNTVTLQVFGKLSRLYLKGDSWDCGTDLKWILSKKNSSAARKTVDIDQMKCSESNFTGKPVAGVMNIVKGVEADCPQEGKRRCACRLENIVWSQKSPPYLLPIITVNCTGQSWERMPSKLPVNTTTVLLQNNKIRDVRPLVTNSAYRTVSDIYLDQNEIDDVDILGGSRWLINFRVFSLRNNHIRKLPAASFNVDLRQNNHIANIYLGNNPWSCDCAFATVFKDLIVRHRLIIKDVNDIRCKEDSHDENSLKMIRKLSQSDVCSTIGQPLLGALDILNIVLAALIILVLGNLLYDYWRYKTTGKLPWIALKMP